MDSFSGLPSSPALGLALTSPSLSPSSQPLVSYPPWSGPPNLPVPILPVPVPILPALSSAASAEAGQSLYSLRGEWDLVLEAGAWAPPGGRRARRGFKAPAGASSRSPPCLPPPRAPPSLLGAGLPPMPVPTQQPPSAARTQAPVPLSPASAAPPSPGLPLCLTAVVWGVVGRGGPRGSPATAPGRLAQPEERLAWGALRQTTWPRKQDSHLSAAPSPARRRRRFPGRWWDSHRGQHALDFLVHSSALAQ